MNEWKGIRKTWRNLLRRSDVERAVDEEMAFHLDMAVRQIAEQEGVSESEARAEAKRRFGDRTGFSSDCIRMEEVERRRRSLIDHWTDLKMDLTFGVRQIRRTPGVTAAAVLCLALGIGATTAVYDIAHYALFPDTVIREPDRVVRIYSGIPNVGEGLEDYASFSWLDFLDMDARAQSFESLATTAPQPFHLAGETGAQRIWGEIVTWDYFSTLGVPIIQGRDFSADEGFEGTGRQVTLISERYWRSQFGADSDVIGSEVLINGEPFTLVGIVDADYNGGMVGIQSEIFVPMATHAITMPNGERQFTHRDSHWLLAVVGRLRPGVSVEQARSEVEAIALQLQEEYPESNEGITATVVRERDSRLHPLIRGQFVMLVNLVAVVVGLILLLTCANVAGLLLARSLARRREIGIRLSLGAERGRVVRQILTESIILALLAGILGYVMAQGTGPLLRSIMPPLDLPLDLGISSSPGALLFVFATALVTGLLFGLTPALEVTRQDLVSTLTTGRVSAGRRSRRLRRLMVSVQVAVSMVLLVLTGMAVRSLHNARDIDVGFEAGDIICASVFTDLQGYDEDRSRQYFVRVTERLRTLPGVRAVATGHMNQLAPTINMINVVPEGWEDRIDELPGCMYNYIDEAYLPALQIPLERGRNFSSADGPEAPPVAIVNRAFVDRFWAGEDPIGRTVRRHSVHWSVIGVVPTGKYFGLGEEPRPFIYIPLRQEMQALFTFYIDLDRVNEAALQAVRGVFTEIDPAMPVAEIIQLQSYVDTALLTARVIAGLVSAFGGLALLLAAIGLYGLIAYAVHQRTAEIGIRMAVGAGRGDVIRLMVGGGLRQIAVALAVGLVLGGFASSAVHGLFFGLAPIDVTSVGTALLVLLTTALLATWLPARRASQLDPVRALTVE